MYFSSNFLFLSASQRICALFVSPYARIRECRKNRGLIEAKERGSTISGREMQIENLRPPYARVHRQENWGCARIIRITRGMLSYNVLYPTTGMGELFFFSPYPSKYVDYIWWSSRRLRFNSRQLSRNIQTYLILFDRTLDTKLRINEKTTMIFQYIRGHLVELWFYVETHICVSRNWTTFQTLSRYFISVNCYIALL